MIIVILCKIENQKIEPMNNSLRLVFPTFLLFFFILHVQTAKGSHIMGGDLTYVCLGADTYMLQLRLMRDCNGISLGNQATIKMTSPTCGTQQMTLNLLAGYPIVVTPLCNNEPDICIDGFGTYGIHEYVYKSPVTLTGCWANASDITFSWESCCRNNTITTLNPPGATYISADLDASLAPCNSSPYFSNSTFSFYCLNQQVNYNLDVNEADGDSLSFSLVNCLQNDSTSAPYISPYSGSAPLTTANGMSIDSTTGTLQFTPTVLQTSIVCVLVEEYRNGVKISEVLRDMQFTIINCLNTIPIASGINGTASSSGSTGGFEMTVCPGDSVHFNVSSYDENISTTIIGNGPQTITMTWNQAILGASFSADTASAPTGTFSWIPTINDVGIHRFIIKVEDDACPVLGNNYYTYTIRVKEAPVFETGLPLGTCSPNDSVLLQPNFVNSNFTGTVMWQPTNGLAQPNSISTKASPDSFMVYTATAISSNGCAFQDSVFVTISSGIVLPPLNDTITTCQGSAILDATISNNNSSFFENPIDINIPDNDPSGAYSPIQVSGVSQTIVGSGSVQSVCVTINHMWNSDMDIYLLAPDGKILELSTDNGGGGNNGYSNTCFSPSATNSIDSVPPPFNGEYLPEGDFTSLNGSPVNGIWQLWVIDDGTFFTGNIDHWSITFGNAVFYSWSPSSSLSCNDCSNPIASPTQNTTYTVIASDVFGCSDTGNILLEVDTNVVTLDANVDIISDYNGYAVSCAGGSDGIAAVTMNNGTPPYHYTWSHNSNLNTSTISNLSAGIYIVVISDADSCSLPAVDTIVIPMTPIVDIQMISLPDTNDNNVGTIIASASGGVAPYTYQWGSNANNATTDTVYGLPQGVYSVTITDANGCSYTEGGMIGVIYNSTSVIDYLNQLDISPNPTNGKVIIDLELSQAKDIQISLYNTSGQHIRDLKNEYTSQLNFNADLSDLSAGIYFVRVIMDNDLVTRRLVLMK